MPSRATKSFRLFVALAVLLTSAPVPMGATARAAQPAVMDEATAVSHDLLPLGRLALPGPKATTDKASAPVLHSPTFDSPVPELPAEEPATPGATVSPFDSPLPTPEPPEDAPPTFYLSTVVDPPVVEPGGHATCTVIVVNENVEDEAELTLSAQLPPELESTAGVGDREWHVAVRRLAAGETTRIALPLRVAQLASGPLEFGVELRDGGGDLCAATTVIVGIARQQAANPITAAGGQFASEDGRVRVDFPAAALRTAADVSAIVHVQRTVHDGRLERDQDVTRPGDGTLLHFTLEARDARSDQAIDRFERPVTLTLDLRGLVDEHGLPAGWRPYLAYLADPETGRGEEVPVTFDPRTGLLTAQVDHFSGWWTGTIGEGWQPLLTPPVTDLFSGAATYSYPIDVPPGRNGLQPQASLSYNSRRVDGLISGYGEIDAGPVALGWSLGGTIDIVRERKVLVGWGQLPPQDVRHLLAGAERHHARAGAGRGGPKVRPLPGAPRAGPVRRAAERRVGLRYRQQREHDERLLDRAPAGRHGAAAGVYRELGSADAPGKQPDHLPRLLRARRYERQLRR